MADKWSNYKAKMKEKRNGAKPGGKKPSDTRILQEEVLVCQRLSSEVSGKAQKYSRVGPREFVPFHYEEVTIANIKDACTHHYAVPGLVCDVLAGEQGPSCSSIKQVPDLNMIHVRFIEDELTTNHDTPTKKRKQIKVTTIGIEDSSKTKSMEITGIKTPVHLQQASQFVPKSLSLVEMLKLGTVINNSIKKVEISKFDINELCWSSPMLVDFQIDANPFAEGGFRKAFKATGHTEPFKDNTWVVKRYLPQTSEQIRSHLNLSIEQHTRKQVQMHCLAMNFAGKLRKEVTVNQDECMFGETFKYNKIYLGKIGDEFVTIEEYIPGCFQKYINNDGTKCKDIDNVFIEKAECLVHFSWERSENELIVVDIQGVGYNLCDPEIASKNLQQDKEVLFTAGNLSLHAIHNFESEHKCNEFCKLLGLPQFYG